MRYTVLFLLPVFLFSKPHGAVSVAGQTHIVEPDSKTLEIRTCSERAIIHWKDFSIEAGECTKFIQPSKHAAVLNRVSGNLLSRIDGLLQANGKVYLLNPNGILIGKQGVIQTAEFISSTLDVLDEAFLRNKELLFQGNSTASLINYGTIQAFDGDVGLFAKAVHNHGKIQAQRGDVNLVAAREIVLRPEGEERLFIVAGENDGSIESVSVRLMTEGNAYGLAICQTGEIEASGMVEKGGRIYLVAENGVNQVAGKLTAKNGKIELRGKKIGVVDTAHLDVSGEFGGGEISIGQKGATELSLIEKNVTLDASAKISGDGGKVVVWSDKATSFAGYIQAMGGEQGGNGGFVEVSGKEYLNFDGLVDTTAPHGKTGTLLLDPTDVTISAAADSNNTFAGGNYTYSAPTSNINSATLIANLGATNVLITTNSIFSAPAGGTITVNSLITWSSDSSLSLIANNNIILNQGLVNNAGKGNILLQAQNNIIMNGSPSGTMTPTVQTFTGGITLQALAGSILLQPTATNNVIVDSPVAALTVSAALDLQLLGGSGANQNVAIFGSAGSNNFSIGRDLILTAGAGSNSFTIIASSLVASSPLSIAVGRNVQLTGGSGAGTNFAVIGGPSPVSSVSLGVGGDATLLGGSGANSFAQIGNFSSAMFPAINVGVNLAVAGNLDLTGGTAANNAAIVGIGGTNSGLLAETLAGNVAVAAGNISLTGGSAAEAIAAIGYISSATTSNVTGGVNVASLTDISITATSQSAGIGYFAVPAAVNLNVVLPVNVDAAGTLEMQAPGAGLAFIANNQPPIQSAANVNVHFLNGVIGTNGGVGLNALLYSSQDLVVIADRSLHLGNNSLTQSVSGQVSLVVDNENNQKIGAGQFIKDAAATITTSGPLRIFTARRTQNSIQGLINGAAFVPGSLFVNSSTEKWGAFFYDPFGGFPFTIFYKDEIPAYQNAYGIAISEALRDLTPYDELFFQRIPFCLHYDLDNYFRPRAALTGYDFAEDEGYDILRQRYRNYNTKYSESL